MSKTELAPIESDVLRLLELASGGVDPPAAAKNRVSTRLVDSLLRAPLGQAGEARQKRGPSGTADAWRALSMRTRRLGPVGLAFVLGGVVGGGVATALRSPGPGPGPGPVARGAPTGRAASDDRVEETRAASASEPDADFPAPAGEAAPTGPSTTASTQRRTGPGSPSGAAGLRAEQALLDAARRALAAGRADEALVRLAAHVKAYPGSVFAEEREALSVNALVQSGRYEEARARAALFVRRFPRSMLLSSVEAAIDAIPR